jgi:succinyl-CoA synthetase beta subunit
MDLLEHQGKELFRTYDIPVPEGNVFTGDALTLPSGDMIAVKAQVPAGKREEHGGINIVDREDAEETARDMLGSVVNGETTQSVLLESAIDIAAEYYISLSINRAGKNFRLVFSEQGGSGIEEVSEEDPDAVYHHDFYRPDTQYLERKLANRGLGRSAEVTAVAEQMFRLMQEEDALLVEINPLVLTAEGDLVATDSKVRIDENALFRQEYEQNGSEGLESRAEKQGLEFVNLDGTIGVIGNGAGLVMATLDSINHFGGRPADFLDIGGGADFEKMKNAMEVAMEQDAVKGLFVNIFGGITRCDEVAKGIVDFVEEKDMQIPMVVRLVGTNQAEGRQILEENGIHALDSMDECAEKIVELVGGDG